MIRHQKKKKITKKLNRGYRQCAMRILTYRVGDNEDVGIWRGISSGLGQVADNGGIGVEKIWIIAVRSTFRKSRSN